MNVVTARVHHALSGGRERKACLFNYRKRVDVTSNRDGWRLPIRSRDARDDTGPGDTPGVLDPERVQRLLQSSRGLLFMERQLRLAMDCAAELHEPFANVWRDEGVELHE